jgi:ACS family allantoate permease-like MFS transporter
LQIPSGIAAAGAAIGGVMLSKRLDRVVFTGMLMAFLSLLGCLLLIVLPGESKLAGYYLSWTMTGVNALLTTLLSNNVSGYSKKVFYNAVVITASTIGNFCGPLMMTANQAPEYYGGLSGYLVANALIIFCLAALYVIMGRENKRRAADPPVMKSDPHMDLTDKEDRNIKYIL